MKVKKIISILTASIFSASMLISGNVFSGAENSEAIKIMSIGDSITDGYGTDGSYRKFLYKNLTDSGYNIDMVGPNWSWGDTTYTDPDTSETFTYDPAHCGYSGYSIKDYSGRNGILETIQNGNYLSQYTPDIVILQIGTNDVIDNHEIDSAGERLEVLADYILENISSDSSLFITTIPNLDPNRSDVYSWFGNYRHSADWQTNYSDEEVTVNVQKAVDNYNSQVKALVEKKQASGVSNIYFGNVNSAVTDVTTQLKDGVHPNDTGYKLMGNYWSDQISSYLSGEDPKPTEPVTQPTEATTEATTTSAEPQTTTTTITSVTTQTTTAPTETQATETTTENIYADLIKGDSNLNGEVSITDAVILSQFLSGKIYSYNIKPTYVYVFDVNSDEKINIFDLIALKRMLLK